MYSSVQKSPDSWILHRSRTGCTAIDSSINPVSALVWLSDEYITSLSKFQLYQRASRTFGLVSDIAAKQRYSSATVPLNCGKSSILPVARSAKVLHTPAHGQVYPAGILKIKRLPSLALPVENLRSFI